MPNQNAKSALTLIEKAQKICCVSQSPIRVDGLCSLLGWQHILKKMGKEVLVVIPEKNPTGKAFFGSDLEILEDLAEKGRFVISLQNQNTEVDHLKYEIKDDQVDIIITPKSGNFSAQDVEFRHEVADFDLILALDAPSLESLGSLFQDHPALFRMVPIVNISADPRAQDYGRVNLNTALAGSTSEVSFNLIEKSPPLSEHLDADSATAFLAGIIVNQQSFLSHLTTPSSFEAASQLQQKGARQSDIIEYFFKQKSLKTLKLWGRIFEHLQLDPHYKITWSKLLLSDFQACEASLDNIDSISNEILRFTNNADIAALFLEYEEGTRVQLRSSKNDFDWSDLESHFLTEEKDFGIDLLFTGQSLNQVESQVWEKLLEFQAHLKNLDPQTPLQKITIEDLKAEAKKSNPKNTPIKVASSNQKTPKAPDHIPFEADFLSEKQKSKSPKSDLSPKKLAPDTKEAEIQISSNQKGIPEWLKKSFPEH